MSFLHRIAAFLTSRPQLDRIGTDVRRAARAGADAKTATESMNADVQRQLTELRGTVAGLERELRQRLVQNHLLLTRLSRAVEASGAEPPAPVALASRPVPLEPSEDSVSAWEPVGDDVPHPDPAGVEWLVLPACPVCGGEERTVVSPWNKLLLLDKAPDQTSARYDYSLCHACGILYAARRPFGARYQFLLEHFGEVTAKRGGGREIGNPVLNPYPLSPADRDELRRRVRPGVFVSDHLRLKSKDYLETLLRDRFDNSGHVEIIGALARPQGARVLEIRSRTGSILDGLRRYWNADVYAMPIWESQRFIAQEVYGIPTSDPIDFDRFVVPFDDPFDVIICQHMLTHVLRPAEFFAELRAHLKPGGYIYLHNEPDDAEFLDGRQSMIATLNPLHMQAFDQASLVRALAANGFETVFLKQHDLSHVCLARHASVAMSPMDDQEQTRRVAAYRQAYERSILRLDERQRSRVADEWSDVVQQAVTSGSAEFDGKGRLRLVAR